MAKLTESQWECLRADYEVRVLSFSELSKKYGVGKATISDRKRKDFENGDDWQQGKTEHVIQKKVNAIKELKETERLTEQFKPNEIEAINYEVSVRLAREKIFVDSALKNQELANKYLKLCEEATGAVDLEDLNKHSQITARNKETVLGKQPTTAIQVNNANVVESADEFAQIAKDLLRKI